MPNEWIILDFPSPRIIRYIYAANDFRQFADLGLFTDSEDTEKFYLITSTKLSDLVKRSKKEKEEEENDDIITCIQRELVKDEYGNQYYTVTTNSKCVKSSKSQWYIKRHEKYFNIVSAYDHQCLTVVDYKYLNMYDCGKTNAQVDKIENFIQKDDKICLYNHDNICIQGNLDFHSAILEPESYDNLTCSTRFAKHGYRCCSQCMTVQYTDHYGDWGYENNHWCGMLFDCNQNDLKTVPRNSIISFSDTNAATTTTTCSKNITSKGYPCCSTCTGILSTDKDGAWGVENGEWCGIPSHCTSSCSSHILAQGYSCCSTCTDVVLADNDGQWGIENDHWCAMPYRCPSLSASTTSVQVEQQE